MQIYLLWIYTRFPVILTPLISPGGQCEEGEKCDKILDELENIDDDTDEHGMHFVTTEETGLAKQYGIKTLPALVLFRNGEPVVYKGEWKV